MAVLALVVKNNRSRQRRSGCHFLMSKSKSFFISKRLLEIKKDLDLLIKKWQPDRLCLERLFFTTNAKTAMSVSQARGIVLFSGAEHKLKIIELTPLQVKISATGYGKADKGQVQRMVAKLLNLKKIPKPDDAADAAAIAWAGVGRTLDQSQ